MIFRSMDQYLCDETGDQGDSSVRAGILSLGSTAESLANYELANGLLVRSPIQEPWNNPKNFSRDQLKCLVAGMYAQGMHETITRVFISRLKAFFFAQNTERDWPGTTKYPWPHFVDGERRWADYADPLLPNDIWFLIKAGKVWWAYPFALIGFPFFLLQLFFHRFTKHHEENQMICECFVNGKWALKLYRLWHKDWRKISRKYWEKRNELEYHNLLESIVDNA